MHYCKWCKKQMSGSHRQHRDNPDFKSESLIYNELKQQFRDFAHSSLWRSEDNTKAFFGVDNVSDWWIDKIKELKGNQ